MVLPSPHNPLCAFTTLTFCRLHRPFLAGAKLPSRKAASHCSSPSASSAPSSVCHALSQTPYSSHSSDVASRSKAKDTHRAKTPRRSGPQNPQNAFKTGPVRRRRTATTIVPPHRLRQQRPDYNWSHKPTFAGNAVYETRHRGGAHAVHRSR